MLAHAAWSVVRELADRHPHEQVRKLAAWALPVHERHLQIAFEGRGRARYGTRAGRSMLGLAAAVRAKAA
jgi:hypothetical protein